LHRANRDDFDPAAEGVPRNPDAFADVPFGRKLSYLDECWYPIDEERFDNQLRNAIVHYKVEYDDRTQLVSDFPKKEGMAQEKSVEIFFLDFMRRLLISYREMHRMQQLIKCLFNYGFFLHEPNEPSVI